MAAEGSTSIAGGGGRTDVSHGSVVVSTVCASAQMNCCYCSVGCQLPFPSESFQHDDKGMDAAIQTVEKAR